MRYIYTFLLLAFLSGCASTPSSAQLNTRQFQQIHVGMSRDEVYQLLGKTEGGIAEGVKGVYSEVWVAPPDNHGQKVRLIVLFWADGRAHKITEDILNDYK